MRHSRTLKGIPGLVSGTKVSAVAAVVPGTSPGITFLESKPVQQEDQV